MKKVWYDEKLIGYFSTSEDDFYNGPAIEISKEEYRDLYEIVYDVDLSEEEYFSRLIDKQYILYLSKDILVYTELFKDTNVLHVYRMDIGGDPDGRVEKFFKDVQ